jgi:hypothetical protein
MIASPYLGSRWLRWLALVSCVLTVGLTAASEGLAITPSPPFENRGLAIVNGGVLWFDEETLLLEGPRGAIRPLGASAFGDEFSSSATATAALTEGGAVGEPHFVASVLPERLSAIAQPPRLSGGGCTWWEPSRPYVVVKDDLVATGDCQEIKEHPVREPLYIRSLRGGRWRVMRWLAGAFVSALAAEGPLLALGAHRVDHQMTVSITNLSTGAMQSSFETPLGRLAFASPQRLVVEIASGGTSSRRSHAVSLRLYSSRGKYLANVGSRIEPLISGMHIVAFENGTLSVSSVAGGAPRPVVGFNATSRTLGSFAFRWPELVVSETTSTPLLPNEVRCWSGSYGPSSKPFLAAFDLAHGEPFDAPPATVEVQPAVPLSNCGPAPP